MSKLPARAQRTEDRPGQIYKVRTISQLRNDQIRSAISDHSQQQTRAPRFRSLLILGQFERFDHIGAENWRSVAKAGRVRQFLIAASIFFPFIADVSKNS